MAGNIYVTGDMHRDFKRLQKSRFIDLHTLTEEDYMIICGDFGGIWDQEESVSEMKELSELNAKKYTILFVDGNHENFHRLNQFPVKEWHGGLVHEIRPKILHLMRGQVYEILGKRIFTFGGAKSHDISAGILDPSDLDFKEKYTKLRRENALFRVKNVSWWEEELPLDEELMTAIRNLEKVDYQVDYVFSHCTSNEVQKIISSGFTEDKLTDFFSEIHQKLTFEKWYFGHYHLNMNLTEKDIVLYDEIIKAGDFVKKGVLGAPSFKIGDEVEFRMLTLEGVQTMHGKIMHIDPYGTFMEPSEPSYDLIAEYKGRNCYMKYIRERDILR